jgi:ATP-binding cassette, subfamily B (MDR/TAP), member 1
MRRPTALEVDTSAASSTVSLEVAPAYDISPVFITPVDFKKSSDAISPISSTHSTDVAPSQQPDETTPTTTNNGPAPSVRLLFSLVSRRHVFLLLLPAFISSAIAGGVAPFMTYVIGQSFDAFASFPLTPNPPQSAKTALLQRMGLAAVELVGLAIGSLVLSSVTSCLWIWTGEHNAMTLRKKVYAAVTQKDMVWFDTKMGAEGNVTSVEDEQGPMGAGGLMAKFTRYARL